MNFKFKRNMEIHEHIGQLGLFCGILFAVLATPSPSSAQIPDHAVKPKKLLKRLMKRQDERILIPWQKALPVLGYRIPKDIENIPSLIRENIGTVDQINKYQPADRRYRNLQDFFEQNRGNVLNLSVAEGGLDIYHIATWNENYTQVEVSKAFSDNPKLIAKLSEYEELKAILDPENKSLVAGIKADATYLVRLSDLGVSPSKDFVLDKSEDWGEGQVQVADPGDDAFVNFEVQKDAEGQKYLLAYMVNAEYAILPGGADIEMRPINYIPPAELSLLGTESAKTHQSLCEQLFAIRPPEESLTAGLIKNIQPNTGAAMSAREYIAKFLK